MLCSGQDRLDLVEKNKFSQNQNADSKHFVDLHERLRYRQVSTSTNSQNELRAIEQ
jgi:hypothetical protein